MKGTPFMDDRFQQAKNFSAIGPMVQLNRVDLEEWDHWAEYGTHSLHLMGLKDPHYHPVYLHIIWI
jgi:hypothetical protein